MRNMKSRLVSADDICVFLRQIPEVHVDVAIAAVNHMMICPRHLQAGPNDYSMEDFFSARTLSILHQIQFQGCRALKCNEVDQLQAHHR